MRIVHVAPFGPNAAGIYESARDLVRADALMGHEAHFVDVGVQVVGKATREPAQIGAIDDRGDYRLVTAHPDVCNTADVIMLHTGCSNEWLVWNQAPIIMVVHGTPVAAFRVEQRGPLQSYSVYTQASQWGRVKAMVYFWPEFRPYWDVMFPEGKSVVFPYPPVDRARFGPDGPAFDIPRFQRGRYNGLICDSWREDCDIMELTHGALEAARRIQGLVWHIYAVPEPLGPFAHLIKALRQIGALGAVGGRMKNIDQLYRGFDFVLSARRSISRVIAEALCSGTPVIAARKCATASLWADPEDPDEVASAVQALVYRLENDRDALRAETEKLAQRFDLVSYGQAMTRLYQDILH